MYPEAGSWESTFSRIFAAKILYGPIYWKLPQAAKMEEHPKYFSEPIPTTMYIYLLLYFKVSVLSFFLIEENWRIIIKLTWFKVNMNFLKMNEQNVHLLVTYHTIITSCYRACLTSCETMIKTCIRLMCLYNLFYEDLCDFLGNKQHYKLTNLNYTRQIKKQLKTLKWRVLYDL